MKRKLLSAVLLLSLAFTLLTGCAGEELEAVTLNSGTDTLQLTIDHERCTITHGEDVYAFDIRYGSSSTSFEITYPNGATYNSTESGMMYTSGWSDGYDPERYLSGDLLITLLTEEYAAKPFNPAPLIGLVVIALGILNVARPQIGWFLAYGWRYRDAEPSDLALTAERVGGVTAIVAGIALLFVQ